MQLFSSHPGPPSGPRETSKTYSRCRAGIYTCKLSPSGVTINEMLEIAFLMKKQSRNSLLVDGV